jgi:hypothetical protein
MIIKEQSYKQKLLNSGWVSTRPKNLDPKVYSTKTLKDGSVLYKRKDGKPIDQSEAVSFEGTYVVTGIPKIDKLKIQIYKSKDDNKEESYFLSSLNLQKIPQLKNYTISKLTPNKDNPNIFSVSNKSGEEIVDAITFTNDAFTFKYPFLGRDITINATKEATNDDSTNTKTSTPEKTNNKTDTKTSVDTDSKIPKIKTTTVTFEKTPEDKTPKKQCADFPFELGCVNPKIGDFNAVVFRGNRYDDTYTTSVQDHLNRLSWFTKENKNKELTRDIWDHFMNKRVIKESIKKVLKEYINNKK